MEEYDTGMILRQTGEMVRLAPRAALIFWLALALPTTALAVLPGGGGDARFAFVGGIVSIFGQFIVSGRVARRAGLMQADDVPGRAGSYALLSIVSGLAILLGIFLLVLPGLYLLARWSIAVPIVIAEGKGMGAALGASWTRTRGRAVPICLAFLVVGTGLVVSAVLDLFLMPEYGPAPLVPALASNLLAYASTVLTWFLAMAIYSFSAREAAPQLEQIFA